MDLQASSRVNATASVAALLGERRAIYLKVAAEAAKESAEQAEADLEAKRREVQRRLAADKNSEDEEVAQKEREAYEEAKGAVENLKTDITVAHQGEQDRSVKLAEHVQQLRATVTAKMAHVNEVNETLNAQNVQHEEAMEKEKEELADEEATRANETRAHLQEIRDERTEERVRRVEEGSFKRHQRLAAVLDDLHNRTQLAEDKLKERIEEVVQKQTGQQQQAAGAGGPDGSTENSKLSASAGTSTAATSTAPAPAPSLHQMARFTNELHGGGGGRRQRKRTYDHVKEAIALGSKLSATLRTHMTIDEPIGHGGPPKPEGQGAAISYSNSNPT
eukprot:g6457.t1